MWKVDILARILKAILCKLLSSDEEERLFL